MAEMRKQRMLVLENGSVFYGYGFGSAKDCLCELVFNTAVVGYQELVTDPGYMGQGVVMTYPLIGNYGITEEDNESRTPTLSALIVREYCDEPSNFRYVQTLGEFMEDNGIVGLEGVDTRGVTRMLRDEGSQMGIICDADVAVEDALKRIKDYEQPHDFISRVSCKKKWYARTPNPRYNVVAIDCGIKQSIVQNLNKCGCNVTVVPYDTTAETILSFKPDGVVISNGPGDPRDAKETIDTLRQLRGKVPMLGIDAGYQMICLAAGAKVSRMRAGHHGGNHPVRELKTGKVIITAQGHGYAVEEASLADTGLAVTYKNVLDGSVEGVEGKKTIGVQFHPEGGPGPEDSSYLFNQLIDMMKEAR